MQVYALTSSQSLHETLDLFLTREAAEAESHFVQVDQKSESSQVLETLQRIESDVAELKAQLAVRSSS
jgi:hypothetical protein